VANKNVIPFDPRPPMQTSGVRFGTPALTTREMKEPEMKIIGQWIDQILTNYEDETLIDRIGKEVLKMCEAFPVPNQK
jgi:glycine hydroxymethyltransferase